MKPEAVIIGRTDIDFPTFVGIASKVLGYSPAAAGDTSGKRLADATRFLGCLAALRDEKAPAELTPKYLHHVSFSVLLIADEQDIMEVLECVSSMAFVTAETTVRGVLMAVVTGTLTQWQGAVVSGSAPDISSVVRFLFNRVHGLFCDEGLNAWVNFRRREAPDQVTYYLEDKRGR